MGLIACRVLLDLLAAWCFSVALNLPLLQTFVVVHIFVWALSCLVDAGLHSAVILRKNIPNGA